MAVSQEQLKSLRDMAQQIGQETIANGLGSPTAQATGSTSYNENASPRELYNQLWEMRRQQAEAAKAESVEQRRERVRSNFLATAQEIQNQQRNRGSTSAESTTPTQAANETSTTQSPKTVQEQNLEYLEQVRRESLNPFTRLLNTVSSGVKNSAAQLASAGANLAEVVAKSAPAVAKSNELTQKALGRDTEPLAQKVETFTPEKVNKFFDKTQKRIDKAYESAEKDRERAQYGLGKVGKVAVDVGVAGTQMLGDIAATALTGGTNIMPLLAARSYGGGAHEARQSGANLGQQVAYGAATAAVEAVTEKISDVLGIVGGGASDDVARKVISKLAQTDAGRTVLRVLSGMGGEAVEEIVSEAVNPAIRAIYDSGAAAQESYGTAEGRKELAADAAYSGLIGAVLGGVGGTASIATGKNAAELALMREADAERAAAKSTPTTQAEANQGPTTRNPLYEALRPQAAEPVAESATTTKPSQTPQNAAQTQEAPAGEITPPTAQNAQGEAGAQPQTAETAQTQLERAQARYAELERAFDNGEVSEEDAPRLAAEMEQRYNEIQELTPLAEQERQSAADVQTQQERVQNGEVSKGYGTPENHIDRRTPESVGKPGVKSFQFDNPQLHGYYVEAAQALYDEVQRAEDAALGRAMSRERGSAITGPIRRLMDMGLTKPQIVKCLQDIIADNGQENYAAAKRVELVLNDMLTNGWQGRRGRNDWHEANADYIAAKDAISGGIKADSWEKYLADHELSLMTGEVTEEELRAEWEQMHPQEEAAAATEPEAAPAPAQPVESASTGTEQSAGTIPASEQTTAERTNGQGPQRERGMSENLRNNEKAEPDLRNSFEQNRDLYTQLTNAEVAAKAAEIVGKGYDAAKNDIYEKIGQAKAGAKLAPEYAVAGYQLANEMVRRGETEAARELCADIAAELTYAGQVGQIGRLILASDPSIRIRTVSRLVQKLNDGLSNRQKAKNVKKGVGTESGEIKVSDEALQRYADAETDEAANDAMDAIEQEIADQIPATFRDKFTALRYLNMLGNLKTQGRNIVGNTAMMAATNAKYLTQHVIELARAAATGGEYQGNTALSTSKELRQQAAADFEANIDEIKGDAKYSDVGRQAAKGVREKQQIFGTTGNALWDNTIGRGLEGARKATNWAMEVGDEIFLRQVYVRSFAGWMKAHGVTDVNTASADQVSAAREFAKKEAQEATFHDSNQFSEFVTSFDANWDKGHSERVNKIGAAAKMITQGIMPFRKTPANVAVRAVEYSPVGIAGTIYTAVQAKKGNASAADVINSAAKNLTGTALFAAGMMLAAAGRARASGDDEDEKLTNFQKLQGAMDYSVKVGDTYISLSQLAPMAIPFFMGVKLNELMESNDNLLSLDSVGDILGVVSEPMLEMSMLSGVNDFLNDLSSLNGDTDGLPALVTNAALSYLSQGLTNSLLGQFEQMSERNRQTTYTDTKSAEATAFDRFLGKNQYKIGKYSAKIPGVDYNQQDYVDAWGRTQSNGGAGERAFNALLNPTYTGKDRSTDVDEELERLYRENKGKEGFPDVFPQKRSRSDTIGDGVVMTPDEYLAFSQESGQKKLELVREFMQSSDYKNLTDEQRAETIHNLYAFADATALQKVRDANGVKSVSDYTKLLQGVVKPGNGTDNDIPALKEKNAAEYIAFDTSYKGAVKAGDYSNIDNLLARYSKLDKNTQAVIAAKNPESINNLLKYSRAGVKSQSYFTIQDSIDDSQIELDKSGKTGGDVQMLGLANADIPESEKEKLIESGAFKLSKNRKAAYDVLTEYGYTVKDAYDFFEDADYSYSPKQSQYVADGTLSPLEVAAAIQRSGIPDGQKAAAFDAVRDLLKGDGGKNDTWVNQRTGKPWTYQSEIDYLKRTGYTYGKGGSIKPQSSGNALYDYYKERAKAQK